MMNLISQASSAAGQLQGAKATASNIQSIVGSAAQDVVGIFDQKLNQVAKNARAIKATVRQEAKLMEHPLEDGATVADHKVIQPVSIDLSVVTQGGTAKSVYDELVKLFKSADLLTVMTKVGVYDSMVIEAMPHDETPDMMDEITIAVRLKEVKLVKTQTGSLPASSVSNKGDSSTVPKGQQSPEQSDKPGSSLLASLFKR